MRDFLIYNVDAGKWSTETAVTEYGAAVNAAKKLDDSGTDDAGHNCEFRVDYAPIENGDYPEDPDEFGRAVVIRVSRREDGNGGWTYSYREVKDA